MRPLLLALPLFALGSPALATGGFDCDTTDGSRVRMSGTVGRVAGSPLVAAALTVGETMLTTTGAEPRIVIARSWIDEQEIRVDLADPRLERFEARLRARTARDGTASGTLEYDGRRHPVRCLLE